MLQHVIKKLTDTYTIPKRWYWFLFVNGRDSTKFIIKDHIIL